MKIVLVLGIIFLFISGCSSLNINVDAPKKVALKELLICKSEWIKIRIDDVKKAGANKKGLEKFSLAPEKNTKMYKGTIKEFETQWKRAHGISILLDSDFDTTKEAIQNEHKISFENCKKDIKANQQCEIEAEQSKMIRLIETEQGTMFGCDYPYRLEPYINSYSNINDKKVNPKETLTNLLTCKETWLEVKKDISKNENLKSLLKDNFFKESDFHYKANRNLQLFDGKIISYYPYNLGQASGVSIVIDSDLAGVKKIFSKEHNISFKDCKYSKYSGNSCTKKLENSRSILLYEAAVTKDKNATVIGCYYGWSR